MGEHELTEPNQNQFATWSATCSCGYSWSSFPNPKALEIAVASHVETEPVLGWWTRLMGG